MLSVEAARSAASIAACVKETRSRGCCVPEQLAELGMRSARVLARFYREAEGLSLVVESLDSSRRALLRPAKELNLDCGCVVDADEFAPTFGNGRQHLLDRRLERGIISELSAAAVPNQNEPGPIESRKNLQQPVVRRAQRCRIWEQIADARDTYDVVKAIVLDREVFGFPERTP